MKSFLEAGFSKIDITPPLERMETYGIGYWYQRQVRFTGIRDPLFVRTLVAGVGESRQVIVSVDSIFDSYGFVESATRRIAEAFSIPAANILITCTHTHSSPLVGRNGAEYGDFVARAIVQSALDAAGFAVAVSVMVASAHIDNVLYNRRPLLSNGSIAELHQSVAAANVVDAGPVNDRMTVVSFRDRTGRSIGGLCHFGIHGVAVQCSELISSDCMGRAIQAVEQQDTSFVLLHLNGACGDIDPALMGDDRALDVMTERLTAGLKTVINSTESSVDEVAPMVALAGTFYAMRRRTRPAWELDRARAALTAGPEGSVQMRHHSGSGYELFLLSEEAAVAALPAEFVVNYQFLRLGRLIFAGIGGEVFTCSGLELQACLPDFLVFPIGLTGGAAGYLPLQEMYTQGGYEVTCAQWCSIAPGEAERLFKQVARDLHVIAERQAA